MGKINENRPRVQEIWSRHKMERVNPMTLTLSQIAEHTVSQRNICVKFNENLSKGSGDIEWTQVLQNEWLTD